MDPGAHHHTPHPDPDRLNKEIGLVMRYYRAKRNLSQLDLAHLTGLDKKTIGRFERAERSMTLTQLLAICGALNVSADDLLRRALKEMDAD